MEIKFRDEADKVPRIKHLRPDFHKIIKEPLTCRILQSHRLTPQPVCLHLASSADPLHALEVALGVAFHPSVTSHLHDSHHLLAGFLFPPLLHFSKVTPLKQVSSHFPFIQMPPSLPISSEKRQDSYCGKKGRNPCYWKCGLGPSVTMASPGSVLERQTRDLPQTCWIGSALTQGPLGICADMGLEKLSPHVLTCGHFSHLFSLCSPFSALCR